MSAFETTEDRGGRWLQVNNISPEFLKELIRVKFLTYDQVELARKNLVNLEQDIKFGWLATIIVL